MSELGSSWPSAGWRIAPYGQEHELAKRAHKHWLLNLAPIVIEKQGAWIGASALVGPGVSVGSHAVLTAGSVATKDLEAYGIYQGNPIVRIKERVIEANAEKRKR